MRQSVAFDYEAQTVGRGDRGRSATEAPAGRDAGVPGRAERGRLPRLHPEARRRRHNCGGGCGGRAAPAGGPVSARRIEEVGATCDHGPRVIPAAFCPGRRARTIRHWTARVDVRWEAEAALAESLAAILPVLDELEAAARA